MDYQLVISGTIGSWWGSCSADYVRYVLNQNKDKDVHVGFCSLGGYVKDGLEMNQAFKDHGKVHAHAFGMNASISTIAMLGCKTIDIVKGSFFLIHNVSVWIDKYEQANKEAIDDMIANLKIQRDSLKTFDEVKTLDEKENELLMEVKKTILEELTVPCTACHYCTDGCPMQIDIPKWMDLYNRVSLNKNRELYLKSKQEPNGPDTCINCGQCKSQCPQNIDIPAVLKKYNEMKL